MKQNKTKYHTYLLKEKARIFKSGNELRSKINKWRKEKCYHNRKDMNTHYLMTSNLGLISEMAEDYFLNIEKPINLINEILNDYFKKAEGKQKVHFENVNPIGIEKEFFCYKEVPFIQ